MKKFTLLVALLLLAFAAEATNIKAPPLEKPSMLMTGADTWNIGWWHGDPETLQSIGDKITTKNVGLFVRAFRYDTQAWAAILWTGAAWTGDTTYELQVGDLLAVVGLTTANTVSLPWNHFPNALGLNWDVGTLTGTTGSFGYLSVLKDNADASPRTTILGQTTLTVNTSTSSFQGGTFEAVTPDGGASATLIGVKGLAEDNGSETTGITQGGKFTGSTGVTNYGSYNEATGGTTAYGVYGTASGATTNWAGYFEGDVRFTGDVFLTGDKKLSLNFGGASQEVIKFDTTQNSFTFTDDVEIPANAFFYLDADHDKGIQYNTTSGQIEFSTGGNEFYFDSSMNTDGNILLGNGSELYLEIGAHIYFDHDDTDSKHFRYVSGTSRFELSGADLYLTDELILNGAEILFNSDNTAVITSRESTGEAFNMDGAYDTPGTTNHTRWSDLGGDLMLLTGEGVLSVRGEGIGQTVHTDDVSNPPTDDELDAIFGAPGTLVSGFTAYIDDNGGGANFYQVVSDGTNWWIFTGTVATNP